MPGARLGLISGSGPYAGHDRNTLKRVAREVFRTARGHLPAMDVVVQLRGPAGRRELRRMLEEEFSAMAELKDGAARS